MYFGFSLVCAAPLNVNSASLSTAFLVNASVDPEKPNRDPNPTKDFVVLSETEPVRSNRENRSSGDAANASAAPDNVEMNPEPLKFGVKLLSPSPVIIRRVLNTSLNVADSDAPEKPNRVPNPWCA